ncbi:hypothetical protein R8Z50_25000 [Longispora sp. K20-0274]|uniref:hypothetical protein n=1 Tax=Longispora sp. K20-0274 TaxID=3088255 RepID=UPI00399A541A
MDGARFGADGRRWRITGWLLGAGLAGSLSGIAAAVWLGAYPIICFLAFVALVCAATLARLGATIVRPPVLTVDAGGLTMAAGGRETRLLWGQVEHVRIVPRQQPAGFRANARTAAKIAASPGWLVVWPVAGVPVPAARPHLPVWQPALAGLRFCDLALLTAPEADVASAVRHFAGERFDPARAPR